jgi:hypothetical protein
MKPAMTEKHTELLSKLKPGKIILPVLIGAGNVAWLAIKDMNTGTLGQIIFSWRSVFWLLVAIMLIALRTFAYMARIRVLTDNELTWLQSFRIIMLWEFTSAITPSTVGGTAFAVLFLHIHFDNLGNAQITQCARSGLHCSLCGILPRLGTRPNYFSYSVD